ncbi:hypothetical protein [Prevotella sp. HJM029]|uniref:hypothetical protein n=1 Tax=Prevotella sp. HJM029 TaxID=1433844 RepID=UPI0012DC669D|nr:hypothetical protein [Prevotella sp. HJM029]
MRPYGATRAGTQAPPLPISIKPCGVPLPHRGYTFDSTGLASATRLPWVTMQTRGLPTTWVVLSFATRYYYYHSQRTDDCPARKWI